MTQEEKQLLLKDLCARLPYGVITKNCKSNFDVPVYLIPDVNGIKQLIAEYDLKPYLRPMSSMTEEEIDEIMAIIKEESGVIVEQLKNNDCGIKEKKYHFNSYKELDWILAHHFDYRGLIPMGLALEAPEGLYGKRTSIRGNLKEDTQGTIVGGLKL